MSVLVGDDWCEAVFKCNPQDVQKIIPTFHKFVKELDGVESLHFIIRDRLKEEVVFSFRVLVEGRSKQVVASKMAYKLGVLLPEAQFAVNPAPRHPLSTYVTWPREERITRTGAKKFTEFYSLLAKMSSLVVHMMKAKYFSSDERVEMAHLMSRMLGCTEYGLLSPAHMEVGYYDRIEDKYCEYLKQGLQKP